jgi:hypothetical protein
MTEPTEPPVADDLVDRPADQSWLEMENIRRSRKPDQRRNEAQDREPDTHE